MTNTALPTIPSNFFNTLADQAMDTIERAANVCMARAKAAPSGSRSATLWGNRAAALVAEADRRGWTLYGGHPGCGRYVMAPAR